MKKLIVVLLALALVFTLAACSGNTAASTNTVIPSITQTQTATATTTPVKTGQTTVVPSDTIPSGYDADDMDSSITSANMSYISLKGDSIALEGSGAIVEDRKITIVSAGLYSLSGTLNNGQIIVDTEDEETVKIVLNGAIVTCSTSAPIYVVNAEKTVITLAEGTENSLIDGKSYVLEGTPLDELDAAIFSKSDLTINGKGSLTIDANYNDGITSKDDLKITGGKIMVQAVNDGIRGRDSIAVKDGDITVNSGGDGMQSNNDEDPTRGNIFIEGGTFNLTSGADGIQAENNIMIKGGKITLASGGGSGNTWGNQGTGSNTDDTSDSAKGLKAGATVTITDGILRIDTADDAFHSNNNITISGGNMILTSGDAGIHADSTIEINGGDISITKSYEGIESAVITINDGRIHVAASDDGINVAGGNDASSINGRPGQNNFNSSSNNYLYVNGGYTVVDAVGDGMDINGSIAMTGGSIIISGPTSNGNGALDYDGTFKISGGYLLAVGSSGMAQAPGTTSTQNSLMVNYSTLQPANTIIHLATQDGQDILSFVSTKAYQSVVFSSPELLKGTVVAVYSGGKSTGTINDGLYSGGTYTAGTKITSLTLSSVVTISGSTGFRRR